MARVIPSFLADGVDNSNYTGMAYDSIRFICGEIQKKYETSDPLNISKKVVEYDVWANVYENGTFASRTIRAAVASDLFGSGLADEFTYTLRPSTTSDSQTLGAGLGSKVTCLAINGSPLNYIIIGGIRNSKAGKMDPGDGHHLRFSFNGVDAEINNDGEFELRYQGANNADGSLRQDVDDSSVGSSIAITKDGNISLSDGDGTNSLTIDHASQKVTVAAGTEVDVQADSINLGTIPNDVAVLGTKLVAVLTNLITAIGMLQVNTLGATSSPPLNLAAFEAVQAELSTILSETVKLQ